MKQLKIKSQIFEYPIVFEKDLSAQLRELTKKNNIHILIDKSVWNSYKGLFDIKNYTSIKVFDPVEDKKNISEVSSYIEFLLDHKIHKDHKLLVIGGGLVQDIGSFTAHILFRGIDWIFIPTTLLAMADSCVGSKSGINVGKYKNQVGTFHPPVKIIIYLPFLDTLPSTEIVNGVGEIIKHALIKGGKAFDFFNKNIVHLIKDKKITEEIIYQSLLIKKEIVEEDEFEKNIRKVLNYGHTFGHALEGYTRHEIPHGVGVLIGMDMANYISVKKGMLSLADFNKIHDLIIRYIKSYKVMIRDYDGYMDFLLHDKKVVGNEVYAILSKGIGRVEIMKTKVDSQLKNYIKEYFIKFSN